MAAGTIKRALRNLRCRSIQTADVVDEVFPYSSVAAKPAGDSHSHLVKLASTVFLWHAASVA